MTTAVGQSTAGRAVEPVRLTDLRAVVFDLDDTLAASKQPAQPVMTRALSELLDRIDVGIVTGGRFELIDSQLLGQLPDDDETLRRLHLLPACGTRYLVRRDGAWSPVYTRDLDGAERELIIEVLTSTARSLRLWPTDPAGDVIEDRGGQITFSALGQQASGPAKASWDPDHGKKRRLAAAVAAQLPDHDVRSGRSTSVDVTRRGVDKAYGVRQLAERLGSQPPRLLFVGDQLFEGGNDHSVWATGVHCRPVQRWQETAQLVEELLAGRAV